MIDDVVVPPRGYIAANVIRACCAADFEAALIRAGGNPLVAIDNDLTSPVANRFLAPNDEVTPFVWRRADNIAELWRVVDEARQAGRIRMRACYCSLFDECWVAESGTFPPRKVNACPVMSPVATPARIEPAQDTQP